VEDLTVLDSRIFPTNTPVLNERITDHLNILREGLEEAYIVVITNNQTAKVKQKKYYDNKKKLRTFQSGDWVYVKEMSLTKKQSSKFRLRW
jgi:sulfur relay (sulfurtransferase) DsrF/TusC family protein